MHQSTDIEHQRARYVSSATAKQRTALRPIWLIITHVKYKIIFVPVGFCWTWVEIPLSLLLGFVVVGRRPKHCVFRRDIK